MSIAQTLVQLVEWWGFVGLFVAAIFILFGIDRIDVASKDAYAFRPLLIPGIVVLWPLVLWRWFVLERGRSSLGRQK